MAAVVEMSGKYGVFKYNLYFVIFKNSMLSEVVDLYLKSIKFAEALYLNCSLDLLTELTDSLLICFICQNICFNFGKNVLINQNNLYN